MTELKDLTININNIQVEKQESQHFQGNFQNLKNLEKLTLKIQETDTAFIEYLGSIFQPLKNLNFLSLHTFFVNEYSDDNTSSAYSSLGNGLSNLQNLCELTLNLYQIPESINNLIQGIKRLKNLEKINIQLTDRTFYNISILDLLNCIDSIQNFVFQFRNMNEQLQFQRQLEEKVVDEIQIQKQEISFQFLTSLQISNYQISFQYFLRSFYKYINLNSLFLEIEDNILFSTNQSLLLAYQLADLQKLQNLIFVLKQNNGFGVQSARCLGNGLKNLINLEKLSLVIGNNNYINGEGANCLAEGIKYLTNLNQYSLSLGECNIQTEGAVSIANSLSFLVNLRKFSLEIGQNQIKNDGAIYLGRAFKNLHTITILKLNIEKNNDIEKIGVISISEGIENLINLINLDLTIGEFNSIESCGLSSICKAISKMQDLQYLNLNFGNQNQIKSSCIQEISQTIQLLSDLKQFNIIIHINEMTQNFAYEIADIIKLIDPIKMVIYYYQQTINNSINTLISSEIKENTWYKQINIITDLHLDEEKHKDTFLPLQSFSLTNSIKDLKINFGYKDLNQNAYSYFGESLMKLQQIQNLYLNFGNNMIRSGIIDIGNSLSKLINLRHLSLKFNEKNDISNQYIEQFGQNLCQLQNLEQFQFLLAKQNNLVMGDLVVILKFIAKLQKLKLLKIVQNLNQLKTVSNLIINPIAKKIKRLVVLWVQHEIGFRESF
ncbi:hypothetical protein ABPG72_011375 [Tetrahymena utriculariae]